MTNDLTELWHRVSSVRPWIGIAALLTAALLAYYSLLGVRYWTTQERLSMLDGQLSGFLLARSDRADAAEGYLESQERLLEELNGLFQYPTADELAATVADLAARAGVELRSMAMGDVEVEISSGVRYQAQPMTVTAEGEKADLFRFVRLLNQEVPVATVSGVKLSNLDTSPLAQVHLVFYLSPEVSPEAGGKEP